MSYLIFFNHNQNKTVIIKKNFVKNIMHRQDAIYLDQLCPKISNKSWRESLYKLTKYKCIYCGKPSESLDHLHPKSKGGASITSNCVPCCLANFNFWIAGSYFWGIFSFIHIRTIFILIFRNNFNIFSLLFII